MREWPKGPVGALLLGRAGPKACLWNLKRRTQPHSLTISSVRWALARLS